MLQRLTAHTDQCLGHVLIILFSVQSSCKSLLDQIADQRGRINVDPNDFEGRGTWHIIKHNVGATQGHVDAIFLSAMQEVLYA